MLRIARLLQTYSVWRAQLPDLPGHEPRRTDTPRARVRLELDSMATDDGIERLARLRNLLSLTELLRRRNADGVSDGVLRTQTNT